MGGELLHHFSPEPGGVCHGINMSMCAKVKTPYYVGDGHPTFNRNTYPIMGFCTPTLGLMTILYYMEIMGVLD